jgi:hypothetical protein
MKLVPDWQHLQKKCLAQFAQQIGASVSLPQNITKLLQLHQYNTIVANKFYDANHVAELNFVNWYL